MMRNSLVQALLAHFESVFEGLNGDYAAVLETLAGITASQALWKPKLAQNSIWQIVEHLIASKLELFLSVGPAHEAHHSGQIVYLKGLLAG